MWWCVPKPWSKSTISPPDADFIKSGDILLLENDSFRGRIVRTVNTKTEFSHAGIMDVCEDGVYLLHADPNLGCVREDLGELFGRSAFRSMKIMRYGESADINRVINFCRDAVNENMPFNNSFRFKKGSGYYCTELIVEAYAFANITLLDGDLENMVILPEYFIDSTVLTVVCPVEK